MKTPDQKSSPLFTRREMLALTGASAVAVPLLLAGCDSADRDIRASPFLFCGGHHRRAGHHRGAVS